jgi:hypothetical protein
MIFCPSPSEAVERFPMLENETVQIVHFIPLDATKASRFDYALDAMEPMIYDKIKDMLFLEKLKAGMILPCKKLAPLILHAPYKDIYKDLPNREYMLMTIDKIANLHKEGSKIKFSKIIFVLPMGLSETDFLELVTDKMLPKFETITQ